MGSGVIPGSLSRRWRVPRPGVALGGLADADVDEGFATHFAQEAVPLVLELAPADGFLDLGAAVAVADVGLAGAFAA